MKNKTLLLVDGNNQAHRSWHAYSAMGKDTKSTKTSVIWGLPNLLKSHMDKLKPTRVIIAWDGMKDVERLKVLPEYKLGRAKMAEYEDFIGQKDKVIEFFSKLGVRQYWDKNFEADDIIYKLARVYHKKGWEVIILSNDKDFHQLLKERLSIFNSNLKMVITHKNLHLKFKYKPEQSLDYLILDGDTSDNISGYPGVGEKTAMNFLNKFGSIQRFLDSEDEFPRIDKKKLLEVYKKNRLLIDLEYFYKKFIKGKRKPRPYKGIRKPEINLGFIKEYCELYNIGTFEKPSFLTPFQNLK